MEGKTKIRPPGRNRALQQIIDHVNEHQKASDNPKVFTDQNENIPPLPTRKSNGDSTRTTAIRQRPIMHELQRRPLVLPVAHSMSKSQHHVTIPSNDLIPIRHPITLTTKGPKIGNACRSKSDVGKTSNAAVSRQQCRSVSSRQKDNKSKQDTKNILIHDIQEVLSKLQIQTSELLPAFVSTCSVWNEHEKLETELGQRILTFKSEESTIQKKINLTISESEKMREEVHQLKNQISILTREILTLDENMEQCRAATRHLSNFIHLSKSKQADAARAIPVLQESVTSTVADILSLEEQFRQDLLSIIRLNVNKQLILKDLHFVCRLWSPSGPSRGNVRISLSPPPSINRTLSNSTTLAATDVTTNNNLTSSISTNEETSTREKDSTSEKDSSIGDFQVTISKAPCLPDETFKQTERNSNSFDQSTWVRIARCSRSSNSKVDLPVHSIEIPFDDVIEFDPALRPHSLLITDWKNIKSPELSDSFIEERQPNTSLVDYVEQQQVLQDAELLIDEFLNGRNVLNNPSCLGLICIGVPGTDQSGSELTFWGTTHPRMIVEQPVCGSFTMPSAQPERIRGLLEAAIDTLFKIIDGHNSEIDSWIDQSRPSGQQPICKRDFVTGARASGHQSWQIEASITICRPYTRQDVSKQVDDEVPFASSRLRRSISTPSLSNLNPLMLQKNNVTEMLEEIKDLPGMSLSGYSNSGQNLTQCLDQIQLFDPLTINSTAASVGIYASVPMESVQPLPAEGPSISRIIPAITSLDLSPIIQRRIEQHAFHDRSVTNRVRFESPPMATAESIIGHPQLPFKFYMSRNELFKDIRQTVSNMSDVELSREASNAEPMSEEGLHPPPVPLHCAVVIRVHQGAVRPDEKTTSKVKTLIFGDVQIAKNPSGDSNEEDFNITDLINSISLFPHTSVTMPTAELSENRSSSARAIKRNIKQPKPNSNLMHTRQPPAIAAQTNMPIPTFPVTASNSIIPKVATSPQSPFGVAASYFVSEVIQSINRRKELSVRGRQLGATATNTTIQSGGCLSIISHLGYPRMQSEETFQLMNLLHQLILKRG